MFLGHAMLAFAIAVFAGSWLGLGRERTLAVGVTAGLFAAVPDVDMVYALGGLLAADTGNLLAVTESFWAASTLVHRAITHSLVVSVPAAVAFTLVPGDRRDRLIAALVILGLVLVSGAVSGWLGVLVMACFGAVGAGCALAVRRYGLDRRTLFGAVLLGLASHPFGDVFTGEPPRLLYPLDMTVFDGRVALHGDPTLHLLGAFTIELTAIWLGVLAYYHVRDVEIRDHVNPRAAAGAAYALAVFVIPPPTLDLSYPFVFSVLAVGMVGAVPDPIRRRLPDGPTALVTGLTAITLAAIGYGVAYGVGVAP